MSVQFLYEDGQGNVIDEHGRPEPMDYVVDEEQYALETSMTSELSRRGILDGRYKYNADGVMRATDLKDAKILILETSKGLKAATPHKAGFDHYKGIFGLLAVLKAIANGYCYADFQLFRKVNVHFVHVHGEAVRHWSMSVPHPNLYLMHKEQRAILPSDWTEKGETLLPFLGNAKFILARVRHQFSLGDEITFLDSVYRPLCCQGLYPLDSCQGRLYQES